MSLRQSIILSVLCAVLSVGFFAPRPAYAVDAVLVGDELRVMNLTRNIKRIAPHWHEFAVQNTGKAPVDFHLLISKRDIFHNALLGRPSDKVQTYPLRLIASDDSEMIAQRDQPRQFNIALQAGEIKRFVLVGDIGSRLGFWAWRAPYQEIMAERYAIFQTLILAALTILVLACLPAVMQSPRKRLAFPPIIALIVIVLMGLRWHLWPVISSPDNVLFALRFMFLILAAAIFFGHRAVLHMPWVERRYWRSVVLVADIILLLAMVGWIILYFRPFFMGVATVEILELTFALAPAILCFAAILSYRFSDAKPSRNRNSISPNQSP